MRGRWHGPCNHHRADLRERDIGKAAIEAETETAAGHASVDAGAQGCAVDARPPARRGINLKLGAIVRLMRRDFDRAASALGVTGSQWTLLAVVASNQGATQRSIADTLDMTEAATGRLIDRMVADGMLERRPKPDDRRAHCIHTGPAAEPVLERLAELGARQEARLLSGLTPDERQEFSRLLDLVSASLQS